MPMISEYAPELVSERPKKFPIAIDWPDSFYREPERVFKFNLDGQTVYSHQVDLELVNPTEEGPLEFAITSSSIQVKFEHAPALRDGSPDFSVRLIAGKTAEICHGSKVSPLADFFEQNYPKFWFPDGSSLEGIEYVALRRQPDPYPNDRIEIWDWTGTDIRTESQGIDRNSKSIQYRVIAELKKRPHNVIFDDDDCGESADVVAISEEKDRINIEFWHCKYAGDDTPGKRIKELYEVCGQAQKSIHWHERHSDLFTHLLKRTPRNWKGRSETRFEVGNEKDLQRISKKSETQRINLAIYVVQPGLSASKVTRDQLELLAVTENYLKETFAIPFGVVGSA